MDSIFRIAAAAILTAVAAAPGAGQPAPADGGDAQRLVALIDYVGGDYGRAVRGGAVVNAAEYDEQLGFLADARRMALGLLGAEAGEPGGALLQRLAEAEGRVRARAAAGAVRSACQAAREAVVARFGLRTTPSRRPNLARAQSLYAEGCAICHGSRGQADTERARALDPAPARFADPQRLQELSPFRVYNSLTFGVRGTAMASFEALTPEERWDLAFYVMRLGHEGAAARGPVALSIGEMATRSDRELLEALRAAAEPDPAAALAYVRREAAFDEPAAGAALGRTRVLLRDAVASFAAGDRPAADRLVLDAYLQGFEPLEPQLSARDRGATLAVEAGFRDLRVALRRAEAERVRAVAADLDGRLAGLGESRRVAFPFLAGFLIYFREGIEAALLIGALLAGVRRVGRGEGIGWIHAGWAAALPAGVATWWLLDRVIVLGANRRELAEAVIALAAAGVLFSVSFWMISKAESRRWMAYLKRNLEASLSRRSLGVLGGLAFLAVYREAAETVLFTQALLLEADGQRLQVAAGALSGLGLVVVAALMLSRTVVRLPLGPFFAVSGLLLCVLAIVFAGSGIYELVAGGYLPPRPVPFPEVPWMGIHPDLTGLLVQLSILTVVAAAGLTSLRRRPAADRARRDR